ncbi:hypothetical protein CC79DRAFT_1329596 [Sarocladium strictum]
MMAGACCAMLVDVAATKYGCPFESSQAGKDQRMPFMSWIGIETYQALDYEEQMRSEGSLMLWCDRRCSDGREPLPNVKYSLVT